MRPEVREWFVTHTSTSQDWVAPDLVARKGTSTVSVVLPARNEAATVGTIVHRLRRHLIKEVPLIDEVLVIDSGSDDHTSQVARSAGATVIRQRDIQPELGDRPGKGEALWKSLFVASGDIIVFIDADLRDFDPQFAVGLLGPLLTNSGTQYVKAIYDRPLNTGQTVLPAGGGRVTELVARPLLNLHFPELVGVVQPLAGEYAGRRSLLEQLPFMSGYGIEIAMLVDILQLIGLDGIAQVDLGCRFHRNSCDAALGRMAGQVYLALLSRLERHDRMIATVAPQTQLTQFVRDGAAFVPEESSVAVTERPPAASVPQYHRRAAVSWP